MERECKRASEIAPENEKERGKVFAKEDRGKESENKSERTNHIYMYISLIGSFLIPNHIYMYIYICNTHHIIYMWYTTYHIFDFS